MLKDNQIKGKVTKRIVIKIQIKKIPKVNQCRLLKTSTPRISYYLVKALEQDHMVGRLR